MRKTWIGIILSMALLLTAVSQASASPGHNNGHQNGPKISPHNIHTSCGAASGTAKSPHRICKQSDLDLM
ncbi:MAG: hypothetical protein J7559_17440, partial [Cohnella sp.]|nr:hypothetical protein [Cohnella sp.]